MEVRKRIGELARRASVTTKAVRYYERLGLLTPARAANGYRDYDERHLRAVLEVRELFAGGIPAGKARPLRTVSAGHEHGDELRERAGGLPRQHRRAEPNDLRGGAHAALTCSTG